MTWLYVTLGLPMGGCRTRDPRLTLGGPHRRDPLVGELRFPRHPPPLRPLQRCLAYRRQQSVNVFISDHVATFGSGAREHTERPPEVSRCCVLVLSNGVPSTEQESSSQRGLAVFLPFTIHGSETTYLQHVHSRNHRYPWYFQKRFRGLCTRQQLDALDSVSEPELVDPYKGERINLDV